MKIKALIAGINRRILEELFFMSDKLECLTSSTVAFDLLKHIKLFEPDVLIVSLDHDSKEWASLLLQLDRELRKNEIGIVVLAEEEDMGLFKQQTRVPANVYLTRPTKNSTISAEIEKYIAERDRRREELRQLAEESDTRKHVLVVDDDPNILEVVKSLLEGKYKVATAINGGLAIRYLSKKPADLILLDYEMPVQSGPQVLKLIRGTESMKDVPVVFLTGVSDTEKIAKVLELKPQGYLLKPVNGDKLLELVDKFLS